MLLCVVQYLQGSSVSAIGQGFQTFTLGLQLAPLLLGEEQKRPLSGRLLLSLGSPLPDGVEVVGCGLWVEFGKDLVQALGLSNDLQAGVKGRI